MDTLIKPNKQITKVGNLLKPKKQTSGHFDKTKQTNNQSANKRNKER